MYAMLLWFSRKALSSRVPTPLCRATAFLWADYKLSCYWWEPIEMLRKLTLTGAVLLINEEFEQARGKCGHLDHARLLLLRRGLGMVFFRP
jgi:hypothetical protein